MDRLHSMLFFLQANLEKPAGEAAPTATPAAPAAQQAADSALKPACGQGDWMSLVVWMLFFVGLMYFLLIRPQKKQRQQHEKLLSSLKKGDRVVTTGGILGTVRGISSTVITVDIGSGVQMQVRKEHVAGLQVEPKEEGGKSEQKEKDKDNA